MSQNTYFIGFNESDKWWRERCVYFAILSFQRCFCCYREALAQNKYFIVWFVAVRRFDSLLFVTLLTFHFLLWKFVVGVNLSTHCTFSAKWHGNAYTMIKHKIIFRNISWKICTLFSLFTHGFSSASEFCMTWTIFEDVARASTFVVSL